jgi:putative redox protein
MKTIAAATTCSTPVVYRQDISTGIHQLIADEPVSAGGQNAGPAPYDLLLASLGACTAITLRMYADRKGWDLGTLRIDLTLLKNAEGETRIERVLHSSNTLNDEQWSRILDIASKTPVTKTIQSGAPIVTRHGVVE